MKLEHRVPERRWGPVAWAVCAALVISLLPAFAQAQPAPPTSPTLPLLVGQGATGNSYSVPIQTLLFFTALSFLPAVLLMMTGFTRIVIVLSLLRQALGTQASPPNQVIVGLSLFLTFFVMSPTIDKVYEQAWAPYSTNQIDFTQALQRGEVPMREFMLKQTRQSDVALFAKLAKLDPAIKGENVPFKVLVPAFVTSELKSAFQIGFLIFIPFLIIDMIVASVLQADAVRAGRWLEPAARLAGGQLRDLIFPSLQNPHPPWNPPKSSPSANKACSCC
jgi:flagellar biosynthesis protein FliP